MRTSTKGRYGVRAMLDLARNRDADPVPLRDIAERQGISEHYLEQLFAALRKAGLVRSVRGTKGGYQLAGDPSDITVGQILRVLEGPIGPTACVSDDESMHCEREEACATRRLWQKVHDAISDVVDTTTLADLVETADQLENESTPPMYYI
ncbi:MAG: Rrf2 family transcriptional regulator [Bacillota bacterium]